MNNTKQEDLRTEIRRCYLEVERDHPNLSTDAILEITRQRVITSKILPECSMDVIIALILNE